MKKRTVVQEAAARAEAVVPGLRRMRRQTVAGGFCTQELLQARLEGSVSAIDPSRRAMATKYLQHFPRPVLNDLATGRWLPVVGAGMSLNALMPPGKRMPLWNDLGKQLGDELSDYSSNGTLDAISAYEHEFSRPRLIERLSELLFLREAQPGEAHKEFCLIPFDIVCTTNFDFLLERQYHATPRYVHPVVDEEQLSVNVSSAGTLLLKLHGDLRHPSRLVVSESDYDGFLARYPLLATYLANLLITKTALFIGYSLDDPDFRQVWHVVSERLGRTRRIAYSIMFGARAAEVARFERRGVKVINLPGSRDKYGEVLRDTFKELREYLRDNVISVSKVTEEQPLRELLLPRDSTTRLCFFSLPLELLPVYRDRVFPAVEELGFVPVTADDVIAPGDSINAKLDALIDRASVMVVDLSSQWTRVEYDMAVARMKETSLGTPNRRPLRLIVIITEHEELPASTGSFAAIVRPSFVGENLDGFVEQLVGLLRQIAPEVSLEQQEQEPSRLLAAKEYRAAVISAMTLLESTLRRHLNQSTSSYVEHRRPITIGRLTDQATAAELISQSDNKLIRAWMQIRNEAVHTSKPVRWHEARLVVEGVLKIVTSIRDRFQ